MKDAFDEEWDLLERKLKRVAELTEEVKDLAERPPVAWRKNVNGVWHYFDQSSPFPIDDCEPLYTKEQL